MYLTCIAYVQSLCVVYIRLGNPKASAHVAVDLQCWSLNRVEYAMHIAVKELRE